MKDLFSKQASQYAAFRPHYPDALYKFVFDYVHDFDTAWDCATGNGQVARRLAERFKTVYATDISQQQLNEAPQLPNVHYSISAAEQTPFGNQQFDLVTVGQALHWFDLDKFHAEVRRVCKPGGLLAVWSYALMYIDPAVDALVNDFYENIVGPYWDQARRLVEQKYASLPFPFARIDAPAFAIEVVWSVEHVAGYLSSWSATQKYLRDKGHDPVAPFMERLAPAWGVGLRKVTFPVSLRLGRVD